MVNCEVSSGGGGSYVSQACDCHLMIEDVVAQIKEKGSTVVVTCRVLAATDANQVELTLTEYLQAYGGAVDKLYNCALATGVITAAQLAAAKEKGVGLSFNENLMKGKQFCAKVVMEPKQVLNTTTGIYDNDPSGKMYARFGFDSFALTDSRAAAIPKDPQFAGMVGGQAPAAAPQQPAAPVVTNDMASMF